MTLFGVGNRAIRVSVSAKTDVGRKRNHNEDRFLVVDLTRLKKTLSPDVREHEVGPKGTLLVVADGMGGAMAGEVASEMATTVLYAHLMETWVADRRSRRGSFQDCLRDAIETANSGIHERSLSDPALKGMGTTLTAVGILGKKLVSA
ncbi:protein phosphatase 2C domain-containing protein, partial [Gemmatimonadota bacterium]